MQQESREQAGGERAGVSWAAVAHAAPEFADRVRRRFDAGVHKTLATLRADGSPRLSGTELTFSAAEVTLGMMPGSRKLADVRRDPRVALHSPSCDPAPDDPSSWAGEAKLAGILVEVPDGAAGTTFRVTVTEVVHTGIGTPADHLVIESWHPDRGYRRVERRD